MWSFIGLFIGIQIISDSNYSSAFHWNSKNTKQKAFLIFLTGPGIWLVGGIVMVGMKITDLCFSAIHKVMNLLK